MGISAAPNKSEREKLIKRLPIENPSLYNEFIDSLHFAESQSKSIRESGRFPLTAVGDINTYSIFAELFLKGLNKHGRAGVILPTGIATDDNNKQIFGFLVDNSFLVSLFDFENREAIFPSVHRAYRFSLFTIAGSKLPNEFKANFGFFLTNIAHIQDKKRVFTIPIEDFSKLNPNTKTAPLFRTSVDAILTARIYKSFDIILFKGVIVKNPWAVKLTWMFHMSNDSHLFKMSKDFINYENDNTNVINHSDGNLFVPVYEGKMFAHYNHRFANVIVTENLVRKGQSETITKLDLENSSYLPLPRFWVNQNDLNPFCEKFQWERKWFIGFKKITAATNERTFVPCLIPYFGSGDSIHLILFDKIIDPIQVACFYGCISSLTFDYISRQKIGSINFSFYVFEQLPILGRQDLTAHLIFIIPKVLELSFTSWDIKAFADDVWKDADEDLKAAITKQCEENKEVTGGHEWAPPEWCEIDEAGCSLPPFKWDEERRAVLKAELDAIYAKLYGLTTEELRYILDPQDVYGPDFPGETFRVLKEKEIRNFGEYRTRKLVLEAWEKLNKE